jgi:hypothetical protein
MEVRSIGAFLQYFGNVRERTMRVAPAFRRTKWIGLTLPENLRSAI